jgi:hypothetical protein
MKPKRPAPKKPRWPGDPVELEPVELAALKGMAAQHPLALNVILNKICRVDAVEFTRGGEDGRRMTDFAQGARWVGVTLRDAIALKLAVNPRGPEPAMPGDETTKSA